MNTVNVSDIERDLTELGQLRREAGAAAKRVGDLYNALIDYYHCTEQHRSGCSYRPGIVARVRKALGYTP